MGLLPSTDWHWQVRRRLGYDDPPSYIQLLVREVTGIALDPVWANTLALGMLAVATVLSGVLNVHERQRDRK